MQIRPVVAKGEDGEGWSGSLGLADTKYYIYKYTHIDIERETG